MRLREYGWLIAAAATVLVVLFCAVSSLFERYDWVGASPDLTVADVAGTWGTSTARLHLAADGTFRAERLDLCTWHATAKVFPETGAGTFLLSAPRELHRFQGIELRFTTPLVMAWAGWQADGGALTVDVDNGRGWVRGCRFVRT